jgi:hypothetical protein
VAIIRLSIMSAPKGHLLDHAPLSGKHQQSKALHGDATRQQLAIKAVKTFPKARKLIASITLGETVNATSSGSGSLKFGRRLMNRSCFHLPRLARAARIYRYSSHVSQITIISNSVISNSQVDWVKLYL